MAVCKVCFRHCDLKEGQRGFCGARICRGGEVVCDNYGALTAVALDPVEKKPLRRFHPGSQILSVGSYGCNLRCPFCQNYEISWSQTAMRQRETAESLTPEQLTVLAKKYAPRGSIGMAFTYNEPLIGFEFVRDTARLVHEAGMLNVMVTNGTAELWVLDELAPCIDAMNIDLKGFTADWYRRIGGDLDAVKAFIAGAAKVCHVELTTLVIPGENDSQQEITDIARWIAGELGRDTPLHISRFFPRFKMTDRPATDPALIYRLADTARQELEYVYTGNC